MTCSRTSALHTAVAVLLACLVSIPIHAYQPEDIVGKRYVNEYHALWKKTSIVVAKCNIKDVLQLEDGTKFFAADNVTMKYLRESAKSHTHSDMGEATYYNLVDYHYHYSSHSVPKHFEEGLAYTYKNPKPGYEHLKGHYSFVSPGVKVVEVEQYNGHVHHDGMKMFSDHSHHSAHRHHGVSSQKRQEL